MVDVGRLTADLADEQVELHAILAALPPSDWDRETPAPGWTIRHQLAHLCYFDTMAELAITSPAAFEAEQVASEADPDAYSARVLEPYIARSGDDLLQTWRVAREGFSAACASAPPDRRWPWYGPSMSLASMITARLMETWAHGQDVADALGTKRTPGDRLRHVVHLGVHARAYSYAVHGRALPDVDVRLELLAPGGELWTYGPDNAEQVIRGSALDFALVVTRRRHRDDTGLAALGAAAEEWLELGQAFAGPPGDGRTAGQFPRSA